MSAADFIARLGIAKLGQLGDTITAALVRFDPETASQVQIDQMTAHCQELAGRIAASEIDDERTHKVVTDLETTLVRYTKAATILGDKMTEANATQMPTSVLDAQLTALMDQIEEIGGSEMDGSVSGTLFDARQEHATAESDLHEWQTVHKGAVAALTTARTRLARAAKDMERAHQQEDRQKARQAQAERDAGLKRGIDTSGIASSVMEQEAQAAKQRTRAAVINTQSLMETLNTSHNADDIVNATLTEATPATSALDRLAKLKKSS